MTWRRPRLPGRPGAPWGGLPISLDTKGAFALVGASRRPRTCALSWATTRRSGLRFPSHENENSPSGVVAGGPFQLAPIEVDGQVVKGGADGEVGGSAGRRRRRLTPPLPTLLAFHPTRRPTALYSTWSAAEGRAPWGTIPHDPLGLGAGSLRREAGTPRTRRTTHRGRIAALFLHRR